MPYWLPRLIGGGCYIFEETHVAVRVHRDSYRDCHDETVSNGTRAKLELARQTSDPVDWESDQAVSHAQKGLFQHETAPVIRHIEY